MRRGIFSNVRCVRITAAHRKTSIGALAGNFTNLSNFPEAHLAAISSGTVDVPRTSAPGSIALGQNAPNPARANTLISFALPADQIVSLTVFDLRGRRVASLLENELMHLGRAGGGGRTHTRGEPQGICQRQGATHTLKVVRDCKPAKLTLPGLDLKRSASAAARSRSALYRTIAERAVTTRPDWVSRST